MFEPIPRGMATLRADLADPAVAAALEVPAQRRLAGTAERGAAWFSPDELLILRPVDEIGQEVARLSQALAGTHHLIADVSDARALFRIPRLEVLAKGTPQDLRGFGPGDVRRTRLGQVACAFWHTGTAVELVVFRSVAGFVADWLSTAATEGTLPRVPGLAAD